MASLILNNLPQVPLTALKHLSVRQDQLSVRHTWLVVLHPGFASGVSMGCSIPRHFRYENIVVSFRFIATTLMSHWCLYLTPNDHPSSSKLQHLLSRISSVDRKRHASNPPGLSASKKDGSSDDILGNADAMKRVS